MALKKHVVSEVQVLVSEYVLVEKPVRDEEGSVIRYDMVPEIRDRIETRMEGVDVEMTPEEEAEFLATLSPDPPPPEPAPPTKGEIMAELKRIQKQIEALP